MTPTENFLLFSLRIELLKTLWLVMARQAKKSYSSDEHMLDVMQLGKE